MSRFRKIAIVLVVILFVTALIGMYFLGEETQVHQEMAHETEEESEAATYDDVLYGDIQDAYLEKGLGKIEKGYENPRIEGQYLTLQQSGVYEYNEMYSGDNVLFSELNGQEVDISFTVPGDRLLSMEENEEGSPFHHLRGSHFVFIHEIDGQAQDPIPSYGYVYEIDGRGNVEEIKMTAPHSYIEGGISDSNEVYVVLKEFEEDRGMHPRAYRPFVEVTYLWNGEEWKKSDRKEVVPPIDEE